MKIHTKSNAWNYSERDFKKQIPRKQNHKFRINISQSCSSYTSLQKWYMKSTNKSNRFTHNLIKRNERNQKLWSFDLHRNIRLKHQNNNSFNWNNFKTVEWTAIHQSMKWTDKQKQHQACVHKRTFRRWQNRVFDRRQNNQSKTSVRYWKENQRLIACERWDCAKFNSKVSIKCQSNELQSEKHSHCSKYSCVEYDSRTLTNTLSCSVMTSKREKKQFADSKKPTQILPLKNQENEKHLKKTCRSEEMDRFTENDKRVKEYVFKLFIFHTWTSRLNCWKSLWTILTVHEIWFDSWWIMNRMTIDSLWYWIRRNNAVYLSNCNSRNQSNQRSPTNRLMYDVHRTLFENDSILNFRQFTRFRYDWKHRKDSESREEIRTKVNATNSSIQ